MRTKCGKQQSQHLSWQTTLYFQTKAVPPALWNACEYVLHYNIKIAHIAGSVNTAAEFFSRLEPKVTEKARLKIRDDIQTTPVEVITSSSDVADEEQFSFTQVDNNDESEEQTSNEKNSPGRMRSNGQQMKNQPPWKQVWENWQRSTETLRRIPWMESEQMHEYKESKTLTLCWRIWNWKSKVNHMMKY